MRAYLDDRPLELDGQSLTAAVVAGKRAADERGRLIIEVWADGEPAPASDLSEPPATEPYAGEVRFVSVEPREVVASALEEAAQNLTLAAEPQSRAAEALARGEMGEAMQDVGLCLQAWESARKAVHDGSAVLGVAPAALTGDPASGAACAKAIDDLLRALREVQRAMTEKDIASLSDALAYDLGELGETWVGLLQEMASSVRSKAVAE